MVGLNPFSKHNSAHTGRLPPPSYKENDPSPLLFAETTVTTTEVVTTTTQTTTHFFSLPLWKRRAPPLPSFATNNRPSSDPDEMGYRALAIEKELPPTPPETSRGSSSELLPSSSSGTFPFGGSPRLSSTSALAQASLGISLPHILPKASSSASSEINSITFTSNPSSSLEPQIEPVPRTKRRAISAVTQSAPPDAQNQRQTRGLSLGPAGFLGFGVTDPKGKSKEIEKEIPEPVNHTPNKLARRSSFWSRKKVASPPSGSLTPARRSETSLVPLPALPPFSPFDMDMMKPSTQGDLQPESIKPHHTRGLSRSHSEKARRSQRPSELHAPPLPPNLILPAPDSPRPERIRRPTTADASIPPSPHFMPNSAFTSSPLASPTLEKGETVPGPPSSRRPRAQTNPPLLRRLSMNLFSSPSPSSNHGVTSPSMSPSTVQSPLRGSAFNPTPVPKPLVDEESPEVYLTRLMVSVSKAEIGGILASR